MVAERKAKFKKVRLPVQFGGVTIGDETAAVSVRILHDDLVEQSTGDAKVDHECAVVRAFQVLCCRRLAGRIVLGRRDEGETQGKLYETDLAIEAAFDTNNLNVGHKAVACRLSMAISEVDVGTLAKFSKHDGFFVITSLMEQIDAEAMEADRAAEAEAERPLLDGDEDGNPDAPPAEVPKRRKAKAK